MDTMSAARQPAASWIALVSVLFLAAPAGAALPQDQDEEPPGLPAVPLPDEPSCSTRTP